MVAVRTRCMTHVFVDICQRMHRIRVAEHLESDSRRPRHLGLYVWLDGGRKMPQNPPSQIILALSVTESENLNCPTGQLELVAA